MSTVMYIQGGERHTLKFLIPRLLYTVVVSPSMQKEQMQPLSLIVACSWTLSPRNSQTRETTDFQH